MFFKANKWPIFGPQILAALCATINTISDGMQYGWAAPMVPTLRRPDSPIYLEDKYIIWVEGIYMVAAVCGLPVTMLLISKIGRKYSILLSSCISMCAWIGIAFCQSIYLLIGLRFVTGMVANFAYVASPMYIAEISDKKIRGFLSSLVFVMQKVGIVIIYSVGPFTSIKVSSFVGVAVIICQLCTFSFMPRSPYYLLINNREEDAKKALEFLRNGQNVDEEFKEIQSAVERQESENGGFMDLFREKSNRRALFVTMSLNAAQNMVGLSAIVMNLHLILEDVGSKLSPDTAGIIFSCLMLASGLVSSVLLDKLGRKLLLVISCVLTSIDLGITTIYFCFKNAGYDVIYLNLIPVSAMIIYAVVFKFGLGIVPIVLSAELFPTSIKTLAMSSSDSMYVLWSAISIYVYNILADNFGNHVPFIVFTVCCLLTTINAIFFVPETKGKSLEEIQLMLKGKHK